MKQLHFIGCIFSFVFISCQKDEELTNDFPVSPAAAAYTIYDFTRFDTGNYWLYKHYTIDSAGETSSPGYDSCYYIGDTIIGSYLYKRVYLYCVLPFERHLRDSSGYLIDCVPILSTAITNDTFFVNVDSANGFSEYYIVSTLPQPFSVPAGTFSDVLEVTMYHYFHQPTASPVNPLISHTYYAKDVGKISEQYYYSGELFSHPEIVHERRLIGYYVN